MRYRYILATILLCNIMYGQFSVSGQFENYPNKTVLVKIYDNAELKLVKNTKTDYLGNFSAYIPKEYVGMVNINLPTGENIALLTNNKNLKFKTSVGQNFMKNLIIIDGDSQIELKTVDNIMLLNEVKDNIIPKLMQIYNPTDEFYSAMIKEDKRISVVKNNYKFSPLVSYIKNLIELKLKAQNNSDPKVKENIIKHFINDDEKLEQSGLFNDLLLAYLKSNLVNDSNESIENRLINATDNILDKTDIQTTRGQNILTSILNFVPAKQYPNFHKKYIDKVNKLTCSITDQLKKKTSQFSRITIGSKVPNIVFENSIKEKKSLYDIKANQKMIIFWASWCPACQKELPYIKEFYKEFKTKGGEIVAISLDYDANEYKEATKELSWYNYTDLLKWDSPIVGQFNIESTPKLLLVDKDNKLIKIANHISEFEEMK